MLVEKEVISDGTFSYRDQVTGLPRTLVVTPEMRRHWHDEGNKMLSLGLTVPVPCEHDFDAHPMAPADSLKNNAGWIKKYTLKDGKLFSIVDITDADVGKKLGGSIRWTSPWFSSFTDGDGRQWNNVISHLALTTRPRVIKQAPFSDVAAMLSMSEEYKLDGGLGEKGLCLSIAGKLFEGKKSKAMRPRYPMAFSLWSGGVKLSDDDEVPMKEDLPDDDDGGGDEEPEGDDDFNPMKNPLADAGGDVKMEELLCDLLQALGVPMPDESNENEFKRHLYEAAMSKIKELTSKGLQQDDPGAGQQPGAGQAGAGQQNPLIQQEQQPMYMSLEEINKLPDPMKGLALSMYEENKKLRTEMDANAKVTASLRDAKLKEAGDTRTSRVSLLGRLSPKIKGELDAMIALPSMALSMGDGGAVVDPMAQVLSMLEKSFSDIPKLLTTDRTAMSMHEHPKDGSEEMTNEKSDELADSLAQKMGYPAEARK
jgi:hypothetical protein